MLDIRDPQLHPVAILDLRPTQMTVGMREVAAKRRAWRAETPERGAQFLRQHMVPIILGPKGRHYVTDHHHLALALQQEGQESVLATPVADLSRLDGDSFWFNLDNRGWTHPFDEHGRRCNYADIPKSLTDLKDDPYRSLAGELRIAGAYAKDTTPFSEFLWADFLRRRIKPKIVDADFDAALAQAMQLARSQEADYLPGWSGPVPR